MMFGWIIGLLLTVILFAAVRRSGVFKRRPNLTVNNSTNTKPLEIIKNH